MKRKKFKEPRNFGGHFGGQGAPQRAVAGKNKLQIFGFLDPDLLKERNVRYTRWNVKKLQSREILGAILGARGPPKGGRRKKRIADSDSPTPI